MGVHLRLSLIPYNIAKAKIIIYSGVFLVTASTCAVAIALTWGGAVFPWSSAQVLVPLIVGAVGFLGFLAYEKMFAKMPLVSFPERRDFSFV